MSTIAILPKTIVSSNGNRTPFTFVQTAPMAVWTVNHNMGYYPDVRVYSQSLQLVSCDIQQVSVNQTRLTFNQPFAGLANLI